MKFLSFSIIKLSLLFILSLTINTYSSEPNIFTKARNKAVELAGKIPLGWVCENKKGLFASAGIGLVAITSYGLILRQRKIGRASQEEKKAYSDEITLINNIFQEIEKIYNQSHNLLETNFLEKFISPQSLPKLQKTDAKLHAQLLEGIKNICIAIGHIKEIEKNIEFMKKYPENAQSKELIYEAQQEINDYNELLHKQVSLLNKELSDDVIIKMCRCAAQI